MRPPLTSGGAAGRRRKHVLLAVQVLSSAVVLALLLRGVQLDRVGEALAGASFFHAGLAVLLQLGALVLQAFRVRVALAPHPARTGRVVGLGLVGGLLNAALPARLGDGALVALLVVEERLPLPVAATAVGLVAVLEAVLFGVLLVVLLAGGAAGGHLLDSVVPPGRVLGGVTGLVLAAVALAAVAAVAARRLQRQPRRKGLLGLALDALAHAGVHLGTTRHLRVHVLLAALQAGAAVAVFRAILPAAGVHLEAPWLAAAGVLAVLSFVGVVLPPGLGAGTTAAAAAVLPLLGAEPAQGLVYGAVAWVVLHLPVVATGLPLLWRRLGVIQALLAEREVAPVSGRSPSTG